MITCQWRFSGEGLIPALPAGGFLQGFLLWFQSELVFDKIFDNLIYCDFSTFEIRQV